MGTLCLYFLQIRSAGCCSGKTTTGAYLTLSITGILQQVIERFSCLKLGFYLKSKMTKRMLKQYTESFRKRQSKMIPALLQKQNLLVSAQSKVPLVKKLRKSP